MTDASFPIYSAFTFMLYLQNKITLKNNVF